MKEYDAFVQALAEPVTGSRLIWLTCPEICKALRPGQFVMGEKAFCVSRGSLRRPLAVYQMTDDGLVVSAQGHHFDSLRIGDQLSLVGPCGRAVEIASSVSHVGLVCEGIYPMPLLGMMTSEVIGHLIVHCPTRSQILPASFLPEGVEYSLCTGATEVDAFWEEISRVCGWAEAVYAVGSDAFYRRFADMVHKIRPGALDGAYRVWHLEHVACGMGRCGGCAVTTPRGIRYECTDGPFLSLGDYG